MYYIIYGPLYLVSLLPFFILYRISDLAFFILYYLVGYRKKVVMDNLEIAFPEKTMEEKIRIAKDFYLNLTDSFIETIKLLSISEKAFSRRATIDLGACNQLAATGKNIQFHCGHQFSWEYTNWVISNNIHIPFIVVYMKINNKAINRIYYQLRSKKGAIFISAQEFPKRMHTLYKNQYSIALAADQNPGMLNTAYWLHFFNKPTPFVIGPDKGAISNNTAVVFLEFVKIKRGVYKVVPKIVTENAATFKKGELTVLYRDFLEAAIREHPDNYLWSHRRWKWEYQAAYEARWIDKVPPPGEKKMGTD
jgi:KDO2-lipid IV(A) lauroyltransferase